MPYCTIDDVRALGVTEEMADDDKVDLAILDACNRIDETTGQFFEPREMTLRLNGTGGNQLPLPIAIIEITSAKLNGSDDEAELTDIVVYNNLGAGLPDDRRNPQIRWRGVMGLFFRGNQNQVLVGSFGFVEADGETTPPLIVRAAARLAAMLAVIKDDPKNWQNGGQNQQMILGPKTKEVTDDHSIEYAAGFAQKIAGATLNAGILTTDPFIQSVIKKYMRPIRMGSC